MQFIVPHSEVRRTACCEPRVARIDLVREFCNNWIAVDRHLRGMAMARLRRADRTTWSIALVLLAVAIWGLTDVRTRGTLIRRALALHKTDVTVYTGAGAAMFEGAIRTR